MKPLKKWLVEALFSVSTNYNHYNKVNHNMEGFYERYT